MARGPSQSSAVRQVLLGLFVVVLAGGAIILFSRGFERSHGIPPPPVDPPAPRASSPGAPILLAQGDNLTVWWDSLPDEVAGKTLPSEGGATSIRRIIAARNRARSATRKTTSPGRPTRIR